MQIIYRNFTESDIENIIAFWNENSGWETDMDRNEFELRFCSSPFGRPILMLAVELEAEEIMGLFCFLPLSVTVYGKDVLGYRPFGAVFKESFRKQFGLASFLSGKHPILQLYNKGIEVAKQIGTSVSYLIPDPRWGKILKVMPFQTTTFPLYSLMLPFTNFSETVDFETIALDPSDKKIDELWESSKPVNSCTVTKNTSLYQAKIRISHGKITLYGVFRQNKLVGVFTMQFKNDGRQWCICDLLSGDNELYLTLVLKSACYKARELYLETEPATGEKHKISILATPLIEEIVTSLGFIKDSYKFTLAVQGLNSEYSRKEIAPENWYVSAND
jgi:hypothetical protein